MGVPWTEQDKTCGGLAIGAHELQSSQAGSLMGNWKGKPSLFIPSQVAMNALSMKRKLILLYNLRIALLSSRQSLAPHQIKVPMQVGCNLACLALHDCIQLTVVPNFIIDMKRRKS